MSAVRQFTDQFQDTFSAMPMSSRITTGLLAILVLIGLGFMVRGNDRVESEMLFGGRTLSEQELDSVEMSFSHAGLNGWHREGRRISIPIESRSEYLAALSGASSLPISIRSSVQDAIEKTTIFESSSQRLAREMHAKEQDLGNKLTAFPEIRWASIEYDLGQRQGLGRDQQQTASVMVSPEGGRPLSMERIADIKKFIGASYAGMSADDVVVIDMHASQPEPTFSVEGTSKVEVSGGLLGSPSQPPSPLEQRKLAEQTKIEKQIGEMLRDYGPIRVTAYIELAPTHADQVQVPQPVILSDSTKIDPNSITRVHSNRATSLHQVRSQAIDGDPGSAAPDSRGGIPTIQPALSRVSVAVGLPCSYYHRVWQQLYAQQGSSRSDAVTPPPTEEQLTQLRQQTQTNIKAAITPALLSLAPHQSRESLVQVYDFPELEGDDPGGGDLRELAGNWMANHWQQVALLLLGFLGLSIALRALRTAPLATAVQRPLANQVSPQSATQLTGTEAEQVTVSIPPAAAATTSDRELLALIEQDPDAAVNVIRDWIGEAA